MVTKLTSPGAGSDRERQISAAAKRYWVGRAHDLGQMDLKALARVFFPYPAIMAYLACAAAAGAAAVVLGVQGGGWLRIAAAAVAGVLIWPLAWYLLHRFVLHGRWLYRSKLTAKLWKRIHFDHHQDPQDLRVLFGSLDNTLPTIAVIALPLGFLIGGPAGAGAAFSTALLVTVFNEFVHCVQHLNVLPDWPFLQRMKRLHVAHHYHSEQGNFGIADMFWDHVFGTFYASAKDTPKSPTVYNLGYTADEAERYPWVKDLSNGRRLDDGPRGINQAQVRAADHGERRAA